MVQITAALCFPISGTECFPFLSAALRGETSWAGVGDRLMVVCWMLHFDTCVLFALLDGWGCTFQPEKLSTQNLLCTFYESTYLGDCWRDTWVKAQTCPSHFALVERCHSVWFSNQITHWTSHNLLRQKQLQAILWITEAHWQINGYVRGTFYLCGKPSLSQGCLHGVSRSAVLSVSGEVQTPRASATRGDSNTPPNPPLTALLTQSIPRGVGCCQVAVAKLWLPWQHGL